MDLESLEIALVNHVFVVICTFANGVVLTQRKRSLYLFVPANMQLHMHICYILLLLVIMTLAHLESMLCLVVCLTHRVKLVICRSARENSQMKQ
jgi:hypothetical protein